MRRIALWFALAACSASPPQTVNTVIGDASWTLARAGAPELRGGTRDELAMIQEYGFEPPPEVRHRVTLGGELGGGGARRRGRLGRRSGVSAAEKHHADEESHRA